MSDTRIEHWPLERLIPYENNPRKNDHAVEKMVAVIREYGFRVPVLAKSSGDLIDGHLRLKAALAMQIATIPVIVADDMTPEQIAVSLNGEHRGGAKRIRIAAGAERRD